MGLTSPEKTPDLQFFITLCDFATKLVKIMINKVVVGSGHGDAPKYVGEGVTLRGTPGALDVPWPWLSCSMAIFRQFWWAHLGRSMSKVHHLICRCYIFNACCDIYVTSQRCTCIGHMTFYYKRPANTLVGGSCLLFVHSSGLTLSPETRMWLVPNA